MELRHLRYFVTLAEELNFTRAARRLNMAQPPLSQQIQQLERELGVQLFKRTNRRVELTYPGQVFLVEVRSALEQVERATRTVRRADGRDVGHLTVGAGVMPIHAVLSKVLPRFRQEYPGVDFRLRELIPQQQSEMLRDGRIDIGFVIPPFDHVDLETETVLNDSLVAALATDHVLAKRRAIELHEVMNDRFVMPDRAWAPTFHDHLIMLCREAGFSPSVVHTAKEFQTLFTLVGAGLGVTLAPASTLIIQMEGIVCVPVRAVTVPVCMGWRSNNKNPAVNGFIDLIRLHARKIARGD